MRQRCFMFTMLIALLIFSTVTFAADKLKAGFIYVGPIGNYGWAHAHNQAREIAEKNFPGSKPRMWNPSLRARSGSLSIAWCNRAPR